MVGRFFEDFSLGEKFVSPARTVTEADIVSYCGLSGDYNPLHTDEEFAKKTQFGTRVAPGALIYAISSGLRGRLNLLDGTVMAMLGIDKLKFSNPVKPGDTIHVEFELTARKETSKSSQGVLIFNNVVLNQHGEQVSTYENAFLVKRKVH